MQLKYVCPYWGQEQFGAVEFLERVQEAGYDGIEINVPESKAFIKELNYELDFLRSEKEFIFIAQQVLPAVSETADQYIGRMTKRLYELAALRPDFINSHTGRDHYSFDDNCRIIDACMQVAQQTGMRIVHETHRGRFSFHASSLLPYLQRFPELELAADFSHWCTVSESLLEDQQHILAAIFPQVSHLHARVGHEQAAQVSDPSAPEWARHVKTFLHWWQQIVDSNLARQQPQLTICPEFGPRPYMPSLPFTQQPIGDQWAINARLMNTLKKQLHARIEQ
ncbi:MAG: sugar phosphate isomerase/epimerase [Chitinophagaceae bacterium]